MSVFCLFVRMITSEGLNVDDETWWLHAFYKNLARVQMSRSEVKVTGNKKNEKVLNHPHRQCMIRRHVHCRPYAAHSSINDSILWPSGVTRWRQCTLTAACMRFCLQQSSRARLHQWENQCTLSSFTMPITSALFYVTRIRMQKYVRCQQNLTSCGEELRMTVYPTRLSDFAVFWLEKLTAVITLLTTVSNWQTQGSRMQLECVGQCSTWWPPCQI